MRPASSCLFAAALLVGLPFALSGARAESGLGATSAPSILPSLGGLASGPPGPRGRPHLRPGRLGAKGWPAAGRFRRAGFPFDRWGRGGAGPYGQGFGYGAFLGLPWGYGAEDSASGEPLLPEPLGPPALPSASGILPPPVQPPAIYVISRGGRSAAGPRRGAGRVQGAIRVVRGPEPRDPEADTPVLPPRFIPVR